MLKAISWLIKLSAFALVVLVAGNYFQIGKKTINDQVKTELSHAERLDLGKKVNGVVGDVKTWAHDLTTDQKNGIKSEIKAHIPHISARKHAHMRIAPPPLETGRNELKPTHTVSEEIPSSERQKLRDLMRELNSARSSN